MIVECGTKPSDFLFMDPLMIEVQFFLNYEKFDYYTIETLYKLLCYFSKKSKYLICFCFDIFWLKVSWEIWLNFHLKSSFPN